LVFCAYRWYAGPCKSLQILFFAISRAGGGWSAATEIPDSPGVEMVTGIRYNAALGELSFCKKTPGHLNCRLTY